MNQATRLLKLHLDIYLDRQFIRSISVDLATEAGNAEVARDLPAGRWSSSYLAELPRDGQARGSLHLHSPAKLPSGAFGVTTYHYDGTTNPPTLSVTTIEYSSGRTSPGPPDEPLVVG